MAIGNVKFISAGTRVKVRTPGDVPAWSEWDDDHQRTSVSVKRRLQKLFFAGDRRIGAEVVYVSNEAQREKLRTAGRVKLQLRDPAGSIIVITAPLENLAAAS
ncbi:MAG: hypothetical protein HRF50_12800 [Phycisphaerae bacterium]|jgi:hypothetical protein